MHEEASLDQLMKQILIVIAVVSSFSSLQYFPISKHIIYVNYNSLQIFFPFDFFLEILTLCRLSFFFGK